MTGPGVAERADPDPDPPAPARPWVRRSRRVGRVGVAVLSVAVLGLTGYGWAQVQRLASGVSTADVIDPGAPATVNSEQNILVLGIDARSDAQGNPLSAGELNALHAGSSSDGGDNTDTMIVIHVPAAAGKITAISIPRDSYTTIAGGYGKHKINSAYTYGKNAASDTLQAQGVTGAQLELQSSEAGARTAIQTVEQLTGLTINHYAAVGIQAFYNISEAVGGVQVCLNAAVKDSYSGVNLPAGVQTIEGSQALAFVRQRHGLLNGDLDRIRRQQAFMASMARTVLSGSTLGNPAKVNALIDAVQRSLTLDRGWDVASFLQQLEGIGSSDIEFDTIPTISSSLQTSDGVAVQIDPRQVKAFVDGLIDPDDASTQPGGGAGQALTTIDVRNGTGATRTAQTALASLAADGFLTGDVAGAVPQATSSIHYPAGGQAAAAEVARVLGDVIGVQLDPQVAAGHVRVDLGSDYLQVAADQGSVAGGATSSPAPSTEPPITALGDNCVN